MPLGGSLATPADQRPVARSQRHGARRFRWVGASAAGQGAPHL